MYSIHKAHVRKRDITADWEEINIGDVVISTAMTLYRDIILEMTNPFVIGNLVMDFIAHSAVNEERNITFNQWLTSIGSMALPTQIAEVSFSKKSVKYKDAFQAHFHARCVNPDTHPDVPAPRDRLKDLLVYRDDTDYLKVNEKALFTVNSFLHRAYSTGEGINVVAGGETAFVSNSNTLGVISFQDIGKVKTIPIREDMLSRVVDEQPLSHTVAIEIGEAIDGKQLAIVIGGALHILDGVIHKNSSTGALIYTSKINMREKYMYMREYINVSTMAETFGVVQDDTLREEQFLTDGFIMALLTIPQSFIVLIESDALHKEVLGLENSNFRNIGFTYGDNEGIIMNTHNYCVSARVSKFKDANKIMGEYRADGFPARRQAYDQLNVGVTEALLPSREFKNELDHVLWLGTNTISITEV